MSISPTRRPTIANQRVRVCRRGDGWRRLVAFGVATALLLTPLLSCRGMVERTDRNVAAVIAQRQREALGGTTAAQVAVNEDELSPPPRRAYTYAPHPVSPEIPEGFEPLPDPSDSPIPADGALVAAVAPLLTPAPPPADAASVPPTAGSDVPSALGTPPQATSVLEVFTLTDALAYAQQHQREYQAAKEDLYLAALALTLERHLWTPVFASHLRTVYGNFGQIRNFDQAMRFVADLSVSQRLPYGGQFTAQAISTLIRDVGKSITAQEGSTIKLETTVPFLRRAGHVAREELIQLERELTYAVRTFERFRRRQLVQVASAYFDLLRAKQAVADSEKSVHRRAETFERAESFERIGYGTVLETQRAEFDYLSAQNNLEIARESFRAQADRFKLLIGMPVDQPLGPENLESIESIEQQVAEGKYPLLRRPAAVEHEDLALQVAMENRLDLLSARDRIDDARRGVAVAQNALLPGLDLTSSVTWNTDPEHYRLAGFSFDRTTWRSELILELPLERTRERNAYRRALIDVRQAQRRYEDSLERIRADVRSALNNIWLQDRSVELQLRNLEVANNRLEFAMIQFDEGDIEVRELSDAEDAWESASNRLNRAKTDRWIALLNFRLATETLRVDEHGVQHPDADVPEPADTAAPGTR